MKKIIMLVTLIGLTTTAHAQSKLECVVALEASQSINQISVDVGTHIINKCKGGNRAHCAQLCISSEYSTAANEAMWEITKKYCPESVIDGLTPTRNKSRESSAKMKAACVDEE